MSGNARRMPFWQLGWRNLWRDVRSGELGMLVLAVLLAVAALTAVAFFSDRLDRALQRLMVVARRFFHRAAHHQHQRRAQQADATP